MTVDLIGGNKKNGEIISEIVHPIIPLHKKCNLKADLNIKFNTYHIIIVTIIIHHWLDTVQNYSPIDNSEPLRLIFFCLCATQLPMRL